MLVWLKRAIYDRDAQIDYPGSTVQGSKFPRILMKSRT